MRFPVPQVRAASALNRSSSDRREDRDRLAGGEVRLPLGGQVVFLFDHGDAQHGVLRDELLLHEGPEVFGEDVVGFLHRVVGVAFPHPVIQHGLDVRCLDVAHGLVPQQRVDQVGSGPFQPVVGGVLHGGELEDPEPVLKTLPKRFVRLLGVQDGIVELRDVGCERFLHLLL